MSRDILWQSHSIEYDQFQGGFKMSDLVNDDDDDEENEYVEFGNIALKPPKKLISTPIGLFQLDDHLNPYKQYQMWMGDTNFDLLPDVLESMEQIPGVEGLKALSRYKFIVAVGKAFTFRDVRAAFDEHICGKKPVVENIQEKIKRITELLKPFEDWAIYCFPNGHIETAYIDDKKPNKDEFAAKIHEFEQAKKLSHGIIMRKHEYEQNERARTTTVRN